MLSFTPSAACAPVVAAAAVASAVEQSSVPLIPIASAPVHRGTQSTHPRQFSMRPVRALAFAQPRPRLLLLTPRSGALPGL